VTNLEIELREEKNRRMELERGMSAMGKQSEDTINSLKMDFNKQITLLQNRIGNLEVVCGENTRLKTKAVKPLSKRKDNSLCTNNKFVFFKRDACKVV
jgi:hypothetical protein